MDNSKINDLMYGLRHLKYTYTRYDNSRDSRNVIDSENLPLVEQVIRQFLLDNHDGKLGQLEAKVFMYEQIISKSNFAPMLDTHTQDGGQEG